MFSLLDKVALVTGGANGIGAGIVKEFLKGNVKFIAILDINEQLGIELENEVKSTYGKKAQFFKCDVAKDEELHIIFDKLVKEFGAIDIVVNNAGICCETLDTYKNEINVNFTALVSSTLKALELMRVDRGGKGGTIINISSLFAISRSSPIPFVYGATKSAVLHLSNSMGMEGYYKHTNVRMIAMCFGPTDTEMFNTAQCYDEQSQGGLLNIQTFSRDTDLVQSAQMAAEGVAQAYKNGKSGSTWLVNNKKIYDISDDVNQAYNIMSKNVTNT